MEFVLESIIADWEAFLRFAPRLFYATVLLIVVFSLSRWLGRAAEKLLLRKAGSEIDRRSIRRFVSWTVGFVGILLALGVLGLEGVAASMLATGGVLAIVLGFAFREIGENFLAGFFLSFSRPFKLNDLIKSGDLLGTVKDIQLRYVHLRTADACDVFVPSAQIFREPLQNYTRDGLRLPSFTIGVAYHDQPDQVVDLLVNAASEVNEVLKDPPPHVSVKEFGSQNIVYEVFFWVDVFTNKAGLNATDNAVKIACWRALKDAGYTFSSDTVSGIAIDSAPALDVSVAPAVSNS